MSLAVDSDYVSESMLAMLSPRGPGEKVVEGGDPRHRYCASGGPSKHEVHGKLVLKYQDPGTAGAPCCGVELGVCVRRAQLTARPDHRSMPCV
jgi:hypothetical protein